MARLGPTARTGTGDSAAHVRTYGVSSGRALPGFRSEVFSGYALTRLCVDVAHSVVDLLAGNPSPHQRRGSPGWAALISTAPRGSESR